MKRNKRYLALGIGIITSLALVFSARITYQPSNNRLTDRNVVEKINSSDTHIFAVKALENDCSNNLAEFSWADHDFDFFDDEPESPHGGEEPQGEKEQDPSEPDIEENTEVEESPDIGDKTTNDKNRITGILGAVGLLGALSILLTLIIHGVKRKKIKN